MGVALWGLSFMSAKKAVVVVLLVERMFKILTYVTAIPWCNCPSWSTFIYLLPVSCSFKWQLASGTFLWARLEKSKISAKVCPACRVLNLSQHAYPFVLIFLTLIPLSRKRFFMMDRKRFSVLSNKAMISHAKTLFITNSLLWKYNLAIFQVS